MKKDSIISILKRVLFYWIPQSVLLAVIILAIYPYLFELLSGVLGLREGKFFYNLYEMLLPLLCFAGWSFLSFVMIRDRHYTWMTGRKYKKDRFEFHKTYFELIEFYSCNDKYKINVKTLPSEDWHNAEGIIFGKYKDMTGEYHLIKRDSNADGNAASFGLPGCGKSTSEAAPSFERFNANKKGGGCGVFAISIKGDLLNFVKGKRKKIKVFTPHRAKGSCHYNPLDGVKAMSKTDRRVFVENLSIIICPEEQGDNAAFFVNGARDYLCGIVLYLLYLHDTDEELKKKELKFPEIVDVILNNNVFEITMDIKKSDCKEAGEYTNSYEGSSEKNVAGIYNHLCKCVRPFNNGALRVLFDGKGDCIKPEDLNTSDIVIDVPQDKYQVYAPAMAIIISNFLQAFMRRPDVSKNKNVVPILFLLDEAVQLNLDFTLLSSAMSTLRSKKVSIFLLMQSVAQLEGRYGEAHAREIIDLCSYISVFNAQDPKSRKFFQELVGRRKMLKATTSLSANNDKYTTSGSSVTPVDEYIFDAADFGDLNEIDPKTGKIKKRQVLIYAKGKYILAEQTPCYEKVV